jgi:hypothetical protein
MEIGLNLLEKVKQCTDQEKLLTFLRSDLPGVALEIAKSSLAGFKVLERLTHHPSIVVRHEVAKNRQTSMETLTQLCDDKDMLVRDYARRTLKYLEKFNPEQAHE